jgi:hypothetical protein
MRPFIACIAAGLLVSSANSALANWWLIRSSDGKCLVVDVEPTGKDKDVTKTGKDVYQSEEQAQADAKRFCRDQPTEKGNKE